MMIIDKYNKEIIEAFRNAKGKGYCFCCKPLTPFKLIATIIQKIHEKDNNRKCLIVTSYYDIINKIKLELNNLDIKEFTNISFLTKQYINVKFNYNYDCIITVGLNGEDNFDIDKLRKLNNCSKFTLNIFTESTVSNDINNFLVKHSTFLKTTITPNEARLDYIYSPVEEWRYGIELNEIEQKEYEKTEQYISECLTIFGNLQNIEKCIKGDILLNISASEFRYNFSKENGWNERLDMTSEYEKNIDTYYNPNALFERANLFYNIVHKRTELAIKNDNKLSKILEIIKDNLDKKICIVSKHGETALNIANYLNSEENQSLGIKCGQYHDCIPESYDVDEFGIIKTYKSGKDKGKPVIIKSQASSTKYEKLYNDNLINIISIKYATNTKLKINFDLIIFHDCITANIIDFKNRFTNVSINEIPNKVYRLYSKNTIEEKRLNSENILKNVQIMTKNLQNYIL